MSCARRTKLSARYSRSCFDRERDVLAILLGDRRRRDLHAGQVDALVARQLAAVQHARRDARLVDVEHDELDQSVVDENAVADVDVVGELS